MTAHNRLKPHHSLPRRQAPVGGSDGATTHIRHRLGVEAPRIVGSITKTHVIAEQLLDIAQTQAVGVFLPSKYTRLLAAG